MTQTTPELQVVEHNLEIPRPLDDHIAEGVAVHGLFCGVQQRLVSERFAETFGYVREDLKPSKHRSYTIARTLGDLSLPEEDVIDEFMHETAKAQNHGTISAQLEPSELGDIVWKGYDPNSTRFLTLFKRTSLTFMTDGSYPYTTMWELKAHPRV